jgi:hypothetical protein
MLNQQAIPDTNFVVKGLNVPGLTQPTDSNRSNFTSETTMDAAITGIVPAKDRPYLTMNDKVFATRYAVAAFSPTSEALEAEEGAESV